MKRNRGKSDLLRLGGVFMEFTILGDVWVVNDRMDQLSELIDFFLSDDTLGIVETLEIDDSCIVIDRFELLKFNYGNTADILRITDLTTGDMMAWKVGRIDRADVGSRLYIADGEILRGLSDCEFVVDVYAYRHDFVLMEYVDGYLLSELDKEYRHELIDKVEYCMDEMYEMGYVAFDVHTDNVMVDMDDRLVFIDVGEYFESTNTIIDYVDAKSYALENIRYG